MVPNLTPLMATNKLWMTHGLEAQTRVQRQGDFIDNFNINETYTRTNTQS